MGMNQGKISLDQKYTQQSGHIFLTGIQSLVRLPMAQIRRDRAAGLNTAGFITGYRGSPLGGYDQQLIAARSHLNEYNIKFQPGVNEELAATAIWGSQQLNLSPGARHDGVVGIWYGKGPGVDRCGDVFRHGNAAGSARNGGVLCLAGDDHGAKSSTVPHQSDHAFISALMPFLYPSSIHEIIEMGLLGIAMSRYSGCWVGMKVITETVGLKVSGPAICALTRIGEAYHEFAQALYDAPVPRGLTEAQVDLYRDALAEQAHPVETKSQEALAMAVGKSVELALDDECSQRARGMLESWAPDRYPPLLGEVAEVKVAKSGRGHGLLFGIQPLPPPPPKDAPVPAVVDERLPQARGAQAPAVQARDASTRDTLIRSAEEEDEDLL